MIKIVTICLGLMVIQVQATFRDWLVDAALAPVVPIGKAVIKMSGGMTKKVGKGVIAYDGDINTLKRNKTPFRLGGKRKAKKAAKKQAKAMDKSVQNTTFINKLVPYTNNNNMSQFPLNSGISINKINDIIQIQPSQQLNPSNMSSLNQQSLPQYLSPPNQPLNSNVPSFPLPPV